MSEHLELESAWKGLGEATVPVVARCAVGAVLHERCESPIEAIFGVAILIMFPGVPLLSQAEALEREGMALIPQYIWLNYRIDWAIRTGHHKPELVFIECDGQDFHSTPAQLERDRKKDLAAKAAGIPLLRFRGTDIFNNYDRCAQLAMLEATREAAA